MWMAPVMQELLREEQRSLAVMCPASRDGVPVKGCCWQTVGGALILQLSLQNLTSAGT